MVKASLLRNMSHWIQPTELALRVCGEQCRNSLWHPAIISAFWGKGPGGHQSPPETLGSEMSRVALWTPCRCGQQRTKVKSCHKGRSCSFKFEQYLISTSVTQLKFHVSGTRGGTRTSRPRRQQSGPYSLCHILAKTYCCLSSWAPPGGYRVPLWVQIAALAGDQHMSRLLQLTLR